MGPIGLVLVALTVVTAFELWRAFKTLIWRPYAVTKYFEKQGIRGPSYSWWHGSLPEMMELRKKGANMELETNSHDLIPKIMPHYQQWCSDYGEKFLYWFATQPTLFISEPELAKEVLSTKFSSFAKIKPRPITKALLGNGLPLLRGGLEWSRHRTVMNPAFNVDKLKVMTKIMAGSALSTLDDWKNQVLQSQDQCKEMEVAGEFERLTDDVMANSLFGASYGEDTEIFFAAHKELHKIFTANFMANFLPGSQYFPTKTNRKMWKLNKIIRNILQGIIKSRLDSKSVKGFGNDLLGMMMESSENGSSKGVMKLSMDEIIAECRAVFYAGHETITNLLTWSTYLLSINQEWQHMLREEVLKECGTEVPDGDKLNKLKLMTMVLYEALRLYGPVLFLIREATEDVKLGNLMVPKNTGVCVCAAMMHHNKKYWGEDASKFNPWRFENGVSKAANHPNALNAFGMGPRLCIGQNYAMLDAKMVLSMLLQRFSFSLSPNYKHAPKEFIILRPQFGLPILLRPLPL